MCVRLDYSGSVLHGSMKLVPIHSRTVFLRSPVLTRPFLRRQAEVALHLFVGRHLLDDLRSAQRTFGVHIAPPEDGFDAPYLGQSPMVVGHGAEPGVDASFDHVGGGIPLASALVGHLDEREQHVLPYCPVESVAGGSQAPMGVLALAVLQGVFLQKALPFRAPFAI